MTAFVAALQASKELQDRERRGTQIRLAAYRAMKAYPGPVGLWLSDEIYAYANLPFLWGHSCHIDKVITELLAREA